MKTLVFLGNILLAVVLASSLSHAQKCQFWGPPVALSDSMEDNHNPFAVNVLKGDGSTFIFWDRSLDVFGSEIVYADYYNLGQAESVVLAEGYVITDPQVISLIDWYPEQDTLAFIFYETNQNSNQDIYYVVMTEEGFSDPLPFVATPTDETHLRVNQAGGLVWQAGDAVLYSRLRNDGEGFYFDPAVLISDNQCFNPDIKKIGFNYEMDERIVWEKGFPDSSTVWYSEWDYANQEWGIPVCLYDVTGYNHVYFPGGFKEFGGWNELLASEYEDSEGNYFITAYDFYSEDGFISGFSQPASFQSDLFTYDVLTDDISGAGYFAFRYNTGLGNHDIYSSDMGWINPSFDTYCMIDSTSASESNPHLFEGRFYNYAFDLICIWESWRNGHSQLFTSKSLVIIGGVPESAGNTPMHARALPNPFNGSFKLEFDSEKETPVIITLFDSFGRQVKTINGINARAGVNSILVDVPGVSAGLYLAVIEADGVRDQVKLLRR